MSDNNCTKFYFFMISQYFLDVQFGPTYFEFLAIGSFPFEALKFIPSGACHPALLSIIKHSGCKIVRGISKRLKSYFLALTSPNAYVIKHLNLQILIFKFSQISFFVLFIQSPKKVKHVIKNDITSS